MSYSSPIGSGNYMSTLLVDQVTDNMPNVKIEVIETFVVTRLNDPAWPELGHTEGVQLFVRYIDEAGDVNTIGGQVWHDYNTLVRRVFNQYGCHTDENPTNVRPVAFFTELNDAAQV